MSFVLVRPARAANVAAACRALKNMGLRRVVLVDTDVRPEAPETRGLAYGAWDVLDAMERAPTLREAVAGCTLVVGTSSRAEEAVAPRDLVAGLEVFSGGGPVAFVFGPEASGLRKDELALCDRRLRVPAHPDQPSLNLAQAVLLVAYELRLAGLPAPPPPETDRATAGELAAAFDDLREALLAIGFLNPANPDAILGELRALVARAGPHRREVGLLRGLARQVRWAGESVASGSTRGR